MGQKITLIGAGNVNYHLGVNLKSKGQHIEFVYSRDMSNAEVLAKELDARPVNDIEMLKEAASDIFIIAVKDEGIPVVANQLSIRDVATVAHTSGTVSMQVLNGISNNIGVFYPLQSFTKGESLDVAGSPVCIEANHPDVARQLAGLAELIGARSMDIKEEQRLLLHICGVFVNNFSNHLLSIAADLLQRSDLSMEILQPLIKETMRKSLEGSPAKMQTGPAIRNDAKTIAKHLEFLSDYPQYKKVYELMTQDIQQQKR